MQIINLWIQEQAQSQTTEEFVDQLCSVIGFNPQSLQWDIQPEFFHARTRAFLGQGAQ